MLLAVHQGVPIYLKAALFGTYLNSIDQLNSILHSLFILSGEMHAGPYFKVSCITLTNLLELEFIQKTGRPWPNLTQVFDLI